MPEQRSNSNDLVLHKPPSINILGIPIHAVTNSSALGLVKGFMQEPGLHQIATVNPEFVMTAQKDEEFKALLREADLCLPDGIGLLWASCWLEKPLPERVAGSDFVYELARLAAENGWRLFLLGAAPGVAVEAANILKSLYPKLKIAGTLSGSPNPSENESIVRTINESQADLLFVAFGAPNQDKWIARNKGLLPMVSVAIGVGGSLDFITGRSRRAPKWIQNLGLEWFHRLITEPWRWRRMLALPHFAIKVIQSKK